MAERSSSNVLAEKLKNEFYERGAAVQGMRATSTSELCRMAEMGRDPRFNCAEEAFRRDYRTGRSQQNGNVRTGAAGVRTEARHAPRRTGAQSASGRPQPKSAANPGASRRHTQPKSHGKRQAPVAEPITPSGAITVERKPFPVMFVLLLAIVTVAVMVVLHGFSQVYSTTDQIAQYEKDLDLLEQRADDLELKLEEKNDIRKIEEIATMKLGMTKEDSRQRRNISLSDGEHIDVIAVEAEAEAGSGILLSSLFSALGDLFERLK